MNAISVANAIVLASGFTHEELTARSRKREKVLTRQAVYYVLATNKMASLSSIGSIFGNDHATVLHAKKTISNIIDTKYPAAQYEQVRNLITIGNEHISGNNPMPEVQREWEDRKTLARWAYRNKLSNYLLPRLPRRQGCSPGNDNNHSANFTKQIIILK